MIVPDKNDRAAVISAGGSLVAWTAGVLERRKPDYKCVAGSSAGALVSMAAVMGMWKELEEICTNTSDSDIYSVNPFNKKGRLHVGNAILRLIKGLFWKTTSLGEGKKLRKLISDTYTQSVWESMKEQKKEVIVTAQDIAYSNFNIGAFNSQNFESREEFLDFMYYSACAPLIFEANTHPRPEGEQWLDSGLTEILPLKHVINRGYKNIDVFIHRHQPSKSFTELAEIKNIPSTAFRCFHAMRDHIEMINLQEGIDLADKLGVKINILWLPNEVSTSSSLHFDKKIMARSFEIGQKVYTPAHTHFEYNPVTIHKNPLVVEQHLNGLSLSDRKIMIGHILTEHAALLPKKDKEAIHKIIDEL